MRRMHIISGIAAAILLPAGCGIAAGQVSGLAAGHPASHPAGPGTVTGRFLREGGPIGRGGKQPADVPLPGTIQFSTGRHRPYTAPASAAGTFSVRLPPGTYQVVGRSPRIIEVDGSTQRETPCSQPLRVTVTAGHTARITLACAVP